MQACYRKLRRYKYQLRRPYILSIGIKEIHVVTEFVKLETDGKLQLEKGYAWDGPSGPSIDTLSFMRAALVHDALYQLIRTEKLPYRYREYADLLLKKICLEDGMFPFRANYVYRLVSCFGGFSAKPGKPKPDKEICVP